MALAVPAGALAAFPGDEANPDPRVDTPNDPGFDPCELDDEQTMGTPPECTTFFEEQFGSYGFSPDSANMVPLAPLEGHQATATQYFDCAQLDSLGIAANVADERSSVLADRRRSRRRGLEVLTPAIRRRSSRSSTPVSAGRTASCSRRCT